ELARRLRPDVCLVDIRMPGLDGIEVTELLLVQAVHAAAVGDALIAPNITRRLLATLAAREPSSRSTQPNHSLTEREEQVLTLVARGRTPRSPRLVPGRGRDLRSSGSTAPPPLTPGAP
ncbi:MAG: hypothetical protein WB441_01185, partial [Nocardioidaceae bacterium]